jgi:hypothetical protein
MRRVGRSGGLEAEPPRKNASFQKERKGTLTRNGDGNLADRIIAAVIGDGHTAERVTEALIRGFKHMRAIDADHHDTGCIAAEFNAVAEIIFQIKRLIALGDGACAAGAEALQLQGRRCARRIAQAITGSARAPLE